MKYEKVVKGKFLSRPNRFIAMVELDREVVTAHVKNTGRCKELFTENAEVFLETSSNPNRKTKYDVVAVKKGEIVGFDDETAWDTKGFQTPDEYWTEEEVKDLTEKLETMIADTGMNICTECEQKKVQYFLFSFTCFIIELEGNVAVKVHSGEKGNQNYLRPEFLKNIINYVDGTVVECNTAYEGARDTTEKHEKLMKEHGWSDLFKVDIRNVHQENIFETLNHFKK